MRSKFMFRNVRDLWQVSYLSLLWAGVSAVILITGTARAEEIRIGGTGGALATMQLLAAAYAKVHPGDKITVLPSLGSGGGIKAVLSGKIQIAVSARPLKNAETKAGAREIELGRTPFVFAVAATNKATAVKLDDLVDMYAGKTERWPDGMPIRLVLRPVGDSDSDMIKSMSEAMRQAKVSAEHRKGMSFAVTDQDTADSLEKIPGALGPSTLAQILSENRKLRALRLNNVEPAPQSVADGSYPYYKRITIVTTSAMPAAAQQFVDYTQSATGRELLIRTGYWVR